MKYGTCSRLVREIRKQLWWIIVLIYGRRFQDGEGKVLQYFYRRRHESKQTDLCALLAFVKVAENQKTCLFRYLLRCWSYWQTGSRFAEFSSRYLPLTQAVSQSVGFHMWAYPRLTSRKNLNTHRSICAVGSRYRVGVETSEAASDVPSIRLKLLMPLIFCVRTNILMLVWQLFQLRTHRLNLLMFMHMALACWISEAGTSSSSQIASIDDHSTSACDLHKRFIHVRISIPDRVILSCVLTDELARIMQKLRSAPSSKGPHASRYLLL